MKKQIYTFVGLIIVMTILTVTATFAQSATISRAHIPFDFSARNQTVTAGDYVINRQDDKGLVWSLRSSDNRQSVILLVMNTESKRFSSNGKLIFRRYGDKYFLTAIETSEYKIGLPKSRAERNLEKELKNNRLAKNNPMSAKAEIVVIESAM